MINGGDGLFDAPPEREPRLLTNAAICAVGATAVYLLASGFRSLHTVLLAGPIALAAFIAYFPAAIALVIWGAMGTGPWYRRWPASAAIVTIMTLPFAIECWALGVIPLCPLAILAAQIPFWLLRVWPGFRFVFVRDKVSTVHCYQYQIKHLLGAMAIVAACLSLAQAGLSVGGPDPKLAEELADMESSPTMVQRFEDWQRANHLLGLVVVCAGLSLFTLVPFFLNYWLMAQDTSGCLMAVGLWLGMPLVGIVSMLSFGPSPIGVIGLVALVTGPATFFAGAALYHFGYRLVRPRSLRKETPAIVGASKADSPPISPFEPEERK